MCDLRVCPGMRATWAQPGLSLPVGRLLTGIAAPVPAEDGAPGPGKLLFADTVAQSNGKTWRFGRGLGVARPGQWPNRRCCSVVAPRPHPRRREPRLSCGTRSDTVIWNRDRCQFDGATLVT